jgi:hypothetical protein
VRRWRRAEEEKRLREIHTLTGNVTSYPDFRSRILGGKRRIWVCLPPSYDSDPERRFPVLYLQDGQNVFDGATAFLAGHEWEADETAERLIEQGRIEPLIIVAVDNAGARRVDEYTPAPDARDHGGGADLYGRMLVEELKPWVDQTWRTRADREDTGIGGSSLGALVSLWVGLSRRFRRSPTRASGWTSARRKGVAPWRTPAGSATPSSRAGGARAGICATSRPRVRGTARRPGPGVFPRCSSSCIRHGLRRRPRPVRSPALRREGRPR